MSTFKFLRVFMTSLLIIGQTQSFVLADCHNPPDSQRENPVIRRFYPQAGHKGAVITIEGANFSDELEENEVFIGQQKARVIEASETQLKVIADRRSETGQVTVRVSGKSNRSADDFITLKYPNPAIENGPPLYIFGHEQERSVPTSGTLRVLVALVNPTDYVPSDPVAERDKIINRWTFVKQYFSQVSYKRLNVEFDLLSSWHTLSGKSEDYIAKVSSECIGGPGDIPSVDLSAGDTDHPNVKCEMVPQLSAESAAAAVGEGFDLSKYDVLAPVIYLGGQAIRGWGGWSEDHFTYEGIDITVPGGIHLMMVGETAGGGRIAHELAHSLVSVPSNLSAHPGSTVLEEDIYGLGLVTESLANAQKFDLLGNHDDKPLFSAFHMEKLGYFDSSNILKLNWAPSGLFSTHDQQYRIVSHGLNEDSDPSKHHVIRIRVSDGLYYYIEARQRPGRSLQLFDPNIPLKTSGPEGGVIVTVVQSGTVHMNQQMRFISLLHTPRVLNKGDYVFDAARGIRISVLDDIFSAGQPMESSVRVQWEPASIGNRRGNFDLYLRPWNLIFQTPDIWVDRIPFGSMDVGGDVPIALDPHKIFGRIHCDGDGVNNVDVSVYAISPPGIGDNGNWFPITSPGPPKIPFVNGGGFGDIFVDWVPAEGELTALKVVAAAKDGEISTGNNWSQENVFQVEARVRVPKWLEKRSYNPDCLTPRPTSMKVAVRNPLKQRTLVYLDLKGVPFGYAAHFPHKWVWLEPRGEAVFDLTLIPTMPYRFYRQTQQRGATIRIVGSVPRSYVKEVAAGQSAGSRMITIGGITARLFPKHDVDIYLEEDRENSSRTIIALRGQVIPAISNQSLQVELVDRSGRRRFAKVITDESGKFVTRFAIRPNEPVAGATAQNLENVTTLPDRISRVPPALSPNYRFRAQAASINAEQIAQTRSNAVYIR